MWRSAVNPDGDDLRLAIEEAGAGGDFFAVRDVAIVAAAEAEPDAGVGMFADALNQGAGFFKRGNSFAGE